MSFDNNNNYIASAGNDKTVKIWTSNLNTDSFSSFKGNMDLRTTKNINSFSESVGDYSLLNIYQGHTD